ncbi:hypothetical protein SK128_010876 [Halocaridina rubra]|uniref:Uncharacterized protein n=1 Tax=Halocaridina rubra TaxID=373956 RepID=A0AAN8ZTL2_HALRR
MTDWEELVGADFAEHAIRRKNVGVSRATSVLGFQHRGVDYSDIDPMGDNPRHQAVLAAMQELASRRESTVSKAVEQVTRMKTRRPKIPSFITNGFKSGPKRHRKNSKPSTRITVSAIQHLDNYAWQ